MFIGIDLGTSAVKALVINDSGHVLGRARLNYGMERPQPGWVEQSPQIWWQIVCKAIWKATETVPSSQIRAVGLSGQLNGLVVVDTDGLPLRHAPIWLDQRAIQQAKRVNEHFPDLLRDRTYAQVGAIHGLSKLLWFMEHEPDMMHQAHKILFPKDYINLKLTGEFATDVTDAAATAMLDIRSRRWAFDLLEQLDVPLDLLPGVHESPTMIGQVTSQAAKATGLPAGIPVVAGAGDMAALAVGTGVTRAGMACATIGTAGHVALHIDEAPDQGDDRIWVMCHAVPGKYFWHGLVMTGGHSLTWWKNGFAQAETGTADLSEEDAFQRLLDPAANVPPGSRGLLFLPFLDGAATPFGDPLARASFVGATSNHGKPEFTRAVLEGVAYNFRDSFDIFAELGYPAETIRIGEGGSRSALWQSILADVLGQNVTPLHELDSSALGAAIIAGVGSGGWSGFDVASKIAIHRGNPARCTPEHREIYDEIYRIYRATYDGLSPIYPDLASLAERERNQ